MHENISDTFYFISKLNASVDFKKKHNFFVRVKIVLQSGKVKP